MKRTRFSPSGKFRIVHFFGYKHQTDMISSRRRSLSLIFSNLNKPYTTDLTRSKRYKQTRKKREKSRAILPCPNSQHNQMIHFIICFYATKMEDFLSPFKNRRKILSGSSSSATAGDGRDGVDPRAKVELVRTRRGFLDVPGGRFGKAAWGVNYRNDRKPSKLLLNVNLQNSVGPVQVVMSPENTVHDLKKAVVEIYVREKRRPFLACSDPRCFVLHYSPFSLEGLKPEEKLRNLVSRNFFLFLKPGNAFVNPSSLDQANVEHKSPFPLVKLMDYLL